MQLTDAQVEHFYEQGFVLAENPVDAETMRRIDERQREVEAPWRRTDFEGFNRLACQFFMIGEPLFELAERDDFIDTARRLLDADDLHIGACGIGDASEIVSADGRPQRQVNWHADGKEGVKVVSFRIALDRHGPGNGPLRVLPGSHRRPRDRVREEFLQRERAVNADAPSKWCFARHPDELEIELESKLCMIWSPTCWHATGVKSAPGPRRALGFNYFGPEGRRRDLDALKHVCPGWPDWSDRRKALWALESGDS